MPPESYAPIREVRELLTALGYRQPDAVPLPKDPIEHTLSVQLTGAADSPENRSGAASDSQLVGLWLQSKHNAGTRTGYQHDFGVFQEVLLLGLPAVTSEALPARPHSLSSISVRHLEFFLTHLSTLKLSPASITRKLSAVKSLLRFAHATGYLKFNVGVVVTAPRFVSDNAGRILSEFQVSECVRGARTLRDRTLIRFLYLSGVRVSEAVQLKWADLTVREDRLIVSIVGKGNRLRHVFLPLAMHADLQRFRETSMTPFVFETRGGNPMCAKDAWSVVKRAAQRAGMTVLPSPHFLRHSHASHAIRHGAPIHVVQQTLGHQSVQTTGRYLHLEQGESSAMYLETTK